MSGTSCLPPPRHYDTIFLPSDPEPAFPMRIPDGGKGGGRSFNAKERSPFQPDACEARKCPMVSSAFSRDPDVCVDFNQSVHWEFLNSGSQHSQS